MDILLEILCMYYFIINIVAFFMMGIDKRKAVLNHWRIKEKYLFTSSLIGGFIGYYLGMHIFHHKTRKKMFHICFFVSLVIHCLILYMLIF